MIFYHYFIVTDLTLVYFLVLPSYGKSFWFFAYFVYRVGAGISGLMSTSNGLDPYIFLSKYEKDAVYERRNGSKGVYFRQSRHFSFLNIMIKDLFLCLYLELACKHLCFPPTKTEGIDRRNKSNVNIIKIAALNIVKGILYLFLLTVCTGWNLFPLKEGTTFRWKNIFCLLYEL